MLVCTCVFRVFFVSRCVAIFRGQTLSSGAMNVLVGYTDKLIVMSTYHLTTCSVV